MVIKCHFGNPELLVWVHVWHELGWLGGVITHRAPPRTKHEYDYRVMLGHEYISHS